MFIIAIVIRRLVGRLDDFAESCVTLTETQSGRPMLIQDDFERGFRYHVVTINGVEFETNCPHEAREEKLRRPGARLWRSSPHSPRLPFADVCVDMDLFGGCGPCSLASLCGYS